MVIGSRTFHRFVPAWSESEDISRPVWADISRFDQDKSRPGHGLVRSESSEDIELMRVAADCHTRGYPKSRLIGWRFQGYRTNLKARKPGFGSRVHFQEDVDRRSEPAIDDQKVFLGIGGNWRLLVRGDLPPQKG